MHLVHIQNKFLMISGWNLREFDTSIGGPTSDAGWSPENTYPELQDQRHGSYGCAKLGNKVIIAGGFSGNNQLKTTEIVDLDTKTVYYGGDLQQARKGFQLATVNMGDLQQARKG